MTKRISRGQENETPSNAIRLQKILSQAGVASRRNAEEMILEGKVKVNGKIVRELGVKANPEKDKILVGGKPIATKALKPIYILLNKPRGCVTTKHDDRGRKTVQDIVRKLTTPVFPVGRLDYNSEGLLVLTNDGDFAQRLSHPKYRIPRTYHVKANGTLDPAKLAKMKRGTRIEGKKLEVDHIRVLETKPKSVKLEIVIHQGITHEVRILCQRMGLLVSKLKRARFGDLGLGSLKPGEFRHLKKEELPKLLKTRKKSKSTS